MRQSIRSQHVVTPEGTRPACVIFDEGKIVAVETFDSGTPDDVWLLPGLVDTHVHVNEPGRTEWEGFDTASRAAAAGGITCLVDMPLNSVPTTVNTAALDRKRQYALGQTHVDYAFWGGLVPGNIADLPGLIEAGVRGFKAFLVDPGIPEFAEVGEHHLRSAMPVLAEAGLPLLVHCESPSHIQPAIAASRTYSDYLQSRAPAAEVQAIEMMIALAREYRCRVHVVHLSAAEALPPLRRARDEGVPVTVETCPHYLFFASEDIAEGATQFKCAPPIRDAANRELLWQALEDGVVDLVATDHSPCPPELKCSATGDFFSAWGGVASLSLALPAIWTTMWRRHSCLPCRDSSRQSFCEKSGLEQIARWMSAAPAQLAGLDGKKGRIAPGYDADFVVFDPHATWQVQSQELYFRHPVSPYLGKHLKGRVRQTFVRGTCVFDDGKFPVPPVGKECRLGA